MIFNGCELDFGQVRNFFSVIFQFFGGIIAIVEGTKRFRKRKGTNSKSTQIDSGANSADCETCLVFENKDARTANANFPVGNRGAAVSDRRPPQAMPRGHLE